MSQHICETCHDTGSLSRDLHGDLDCPHCDVASQRAQLDDWLRDNAPNAHPVDAWLIYQRGLRDGRES